MRRRRYIVYLIVLLVLGAIAGFYFYKKSSLENSNVFNSKVLYSFRFGDGYRFVIVDPGRRSIKLIKAPLKLYDPESRFMLGGSVRDSVIFFEKAFSTSFNYSYWIDLAENLEDFAKPLVGGVKDPDYLFKSLLKRRLKFTDVFRVGKVARDLRTFSNLDAEGLYRLLSAFASYGFEEYEVEGFTKDPLKIEVGGKIYERIYLTSESKKRLEEILR